MNSNKAQCAAYFLNTSKQWFGKYAKRSTNSFPRLVSSFGSIISLLVGQAILAMVHMKISINTVPVTVLGNIIFPKFNTLIYGNLGRKNCVDHKGKIAEREL